jgi:hypothetical protein
MMIQSSSRRRPVLERRSRGPGPSDFVRGKHKRHWVPAFAGMTALVLMSVISPALADEAEDKQPRWWRR